MQEAIEGSLKRLRLDRIDIYQLHVPDPAVILRCLRGSPGAPSRSRAKSATSALSNVTLEHIQRAQKIVPIVSVQNRYSFSDREWDFVLDYCEANGIAFLPWGPMAQGSKANEVVEKIAAARGVSTAVVSLAWLLRRSPVMLPIPGTSNVKHLEENVSAAAFRLDRRRVRRTERSSPKTLLAPRLKLPFNKASPWLPHLRRFVFFTNRLRWESTNPRTSERPPQRTLTR